MGYKTGDWWGIEIKLYKILLVFLKEEPVNKG